MNSIYGVRVPNAVSAALLLALYALLEANFDGSWWLPTVLATVAFVLKGIEVNLEDVRRQTEQESTRAWLEQRRESKWVRWLIR